jgi:acyl carrier protein
MTNLEKLNRVFCEVFTTEEAALDSTFDKRLVDVWDSVHQLNLAISMEEAFDFLLDAEDILELTSYDNARAILAKYDIAL